MTKRPTRHRIGYMADHPRGLLAVYSIGWLIALVGAYGLYPTMVRQGVSFVADCPRVLLLGMAAGILGAVAINFYGINKHRFEKDSRFNKWALWYLTRPFMGAIVGLMSYAILKFINSAEPTAAAVVAASFLFGMQENRFLRLLTKVADIILNTSPAVKSSQNKK